MIQAIFCICVNPIRIEPVEDGYIPTCRANPILILFFEDTFKKKKKGQKVMNFL